MTQSTPVVDSLRHEPFGPERSPECIRAGLQAVLSSATFRRASRLRSLLKYVVDKALLGVVACEDKTAKELFGKDNFDPLVDPAIRVQFGRLRRTLAAYYEKEGKDDPVRIEVPFRRYSPVFHTGKVRTNAHELEDDSITKEQEGKMTIAVLPFSNLTDDPAQDTFCYGLTEEITNGLASSQSLDVVASSSSFQFKDDHHDVREVGKELGVPYVLEGSVRVEDGQARVIAQLARSQDGVAVWSDSFDETMMGSFATQRSIAQRVMETLPITTEG